LHLTHFLVFLFERLHVLAQGIGRDEPEFAVLDGADPIGADQLVQGGLAPAEYQSGLAWPVEQFFQVKGLSPCSGQVM
jgi:hypothetical protein